MAIKAFLVRALENYQQNNNGTLPEKVVIYRDGVGGPTLTEKCVKFEIPDVTSAVSEYDNGYNPEIVYCLIDKLSGTRLFQKHNGSASNPPQGTLVDTVIVESLQYILIQQKRH